MAAQRTSWRIILAALLLGSGGSLALADEATVNPPQGELAVTIDLARLEARTAALPGATTDEERWRANSEMRLRSDGNIPGQLRSYDASGNMVPVRARLYFVQNGQVVARAQTDEKGNFQAAGLREGIYAVVAASPDGFGTTSVKVLPFVGDEAGGAPKVKSIAGPPTRQALFPAQGGIVMSISMIPAEDLNIMAQLVTQYIPGLRPRSNGTSGNGNGRAVSSPPRPELTGRLAGALGAGESLAAAAGFEPGLARVRAKMADLPDLPDEGPWHANHEMRLRGDGNIPGQLRSFDASGNLTPVRARLFFVQKGQVVGRAQSDEKGNFQAMGLKEGVYSVIVASPEGFGAMSVRILPFVAEERPAAPKVKSIAEPRVAQVAFSQVGDIVFSVTTVSPGNFLVTFQLAAQNIPQLAGQLSSLLTSLGVAPATAAAAGAAAEAAATAAAGGAAAGGAAGGAGIAGSVAAGTAGIAAAAVASNNNDTGTSSGTTTTTTASPGGS